MSVLIVRVTEDLPEGFEHLHGQAQAEGVRNMEALVRQWADGRGFADPGALFAAYVDAKLAGVGGVTPQTGLDEPAMRMRRLYVAPAFRRVGVGQALAGAMIQQGLQAVCLLVCNARASEAAGPFWEAMGFQRVEAPDFTHLLRG